MASDSYAVVSDPVEEQDPVAIGIFRADLPTSEKRSILCGHVEILAACPGDGEGSVGFADEVRSQLAVNGMEERRADRKSTRLNSSHGYISYAVFCLKKKNAAC